MKNLAHTILYVGIFVFIAGCMQQDVEPDAAVIDPVTSAAHGNACWGQATAIFAQMGEMGEHASQQPTPRLGLRNLARALYEQGIIADDSMEALGAFVATELDLDIEACM